MEVMHSKNVSEEAKRKHERSRFLRQTSVLMWKSYLQRQRRWRILAVEAIISGMLFLMAIFIAKPVFLTPIKEKPEPPLTARDILDSIESKDSERKIIGYAPNATPFTDIMQKVATALNIELMVGETEEELNYLLYLESRNVVLLGHPVIWIIWQPKTDNMWKFSIRSTERAEYVTDELSRVDNPNPHLRAGFLALQYAISEAIVNYEAKGRCSYTITLAAMPVSPLMQEDVVRKALSQILMCFTLAFIPPMMEIETLVVHESVSRFKRALRMHGVDYSSMYLGWLVYAYLSALPASLLASITIILIFRWIHLVFAMLIVFAYVSVMIMLALIMAMFHNKAWIACVWTALFTLLQTYLAELLVHHRYDMTNKVVAFIFHVLIPPLGLVNTFHHIALIQNGQAASTEPDSTESSWATLALWGALNLFYFSLLMLLQRTIGHERAIGGQVSWKSIIFKKAEDKRVLHPIKMLTGMEREKLQEVDEFVAKAVTFHSVYKSIMGTEVINNVTLDIYRGEFTMIFADHIQKRIVTTMEDLLTGLAYPDKGSINVLGNMQLPGENFMNRPHMMGYCHRAKLLIADLTVEEHFTLFLEICMWNESRHYLAEYGMMRQRDLMSQCNLQAVKNERIAELGSYYAAQLCWALAVLLEPRIVVVPIFLDHPAYTAVIKDKIMKFKGKMTIIKMSFSTLQLEFGDRVFIFDSKILVFGGTPAYLFFKYGREYRVRITLRNDGSEDKHLQQLSELVVQAGGSVRAHLGSMLILRVPTHPTNVVTAFVDNLTRNIPNYGITSLHITVPDSEEVYNRAVVESRSVTAEAQPRSTLKKEALQRIAEEVEWKRNWRSHCGFIQMKYIGWKFFSFYVQHKYVFLLTFLAAVVTGIFMGLSFSTMLNKRKQDDVARKLLHGEILTLESVTSETILVIRIDNSTIARALADAYVFSEPNKTESDISLVTYTALYSTESITEYLVTRAIDSPQMYVYQYAYGMDVTSRDNEHMNIRVLYSPIHSDYGASVRSLAKVFTTLLRHYTGQLNASIEITDQPLPLDLTPWMAFAKTPPFGLLFLLVLSVTHMTLIPSMEHGLVRHMQTHALYFSPGRYWLSLYLWDALMYGLLIAVMTGMMMVMLYFIAPVNQFRYEDLVIIPFLLLLYGLVCIPQAYLFSLGPRVALNAMTYVIVNFIFGETTIVNKLLYGSFLDIAVLFMSISPQFNMAYSIVKIKEIFLYNSECMAYNKSICSGKSFHKCCEQCGILQECFSKKDYFSYGTGIQKEIIAMCVTAFIFLSILFIIEYHVMSRVYKCLRQFIFKRQQEVGPEKITRGVRREIAEVTNKRQQLTMKKKKNIPFDTYGEYLLVENLSKKMSGQYVVHSVYLGVSKGEVLALSGLKRHGRLDLCKIMAGFWTSSYGNAWCMSKWKQSSNPHDYARHISLSCEEHNLPRWMTVKDALMMIALMRGVPKSHVHREVQNFIDALELTEFEEIITNDIPHNAHTKLHFAAAVIGAPPVLVVDECTAYQKFSVQRAMYSILQSLRRRGHAIFLSSSSVESHMPVTDRLAILLDGTIYDIDKIDKLVNAYSNKGYTVVVHLKDEVNVMEMFSKYFKKIRINDTSDVLVNVQVQDSDLTWASIFKTMELLTAENPKVYSYIVSAIPMNYIYNTILTKEKGAIKAPRFFADFFVKKVRKTPPAVFVSELKSFERKYDIVRLKDLPWSVMFHT